MANELILSASLKFAKGSRNAARAFSRLLVDVTGDLFIENTQTIGTSVETLDLNDVAAGGYFLLHSFDTNTYNVRLGFGPDYKTNSEECITLKPGDVALFRSDADSDWRAYAETSSTDILVLAVDA